MRLAYATDLHGNVAALEELFRLATERAVEAVIIGGDLTPKQMAVRLPTSDDESGDERGGEVIPFQALREDPVTKTFTAALRAILADNARVGTDRLARQLARGGTIIRSETNHFFESRSMLLEQQVLDKLHVWCRGVPLKQLMLTDEELQIVVVDCLPHWLATLERGWSDEQRLGFLRKVKNRTDVALREFDELAPSKQIVGCLMYELYGQAATPVLKRWLRELGAEATPVNDYLRQTVERLFYGLIQASSYRSLIAEWMIEALVPYTTLAELRRSSTTPERYAEGQRAFVAETFIPSIVAWRAQNGGRPVYVLIGNDDDVTCQSLLAEAQEAGTLVALHNQVTSLGDDLAIAGYGRVTSLPAWTTYRAWLVADDVLLSDLQALHGASAGKPILWVIHQPPYGVLDQSEQDGSLGSQKLMEFIRITNPPAVLVGHVHEAPRLAGTITARVGKTLCVNPGGEHDHGLRAAIIDTATWSVESA